MARPRKYKLDIPGLYPIFDKRTNRVYWRYKHPLTGKFHGLGTDENEAAKIASEANQRLADQQLKNTILIKDTIASKTGGSITVMTWLDCYLKILQERLQLGEIKPATMNQRRSHINNINRFIGNKALSDVNTRDIIEILNFYRNDNKNPMAANVRTTLIDIFKEAQHNGEVTPGHNPALATKSVKVKVKRERLSLEEWRIIYSTADKPYLKNAMLLAVVTGQRLTDISNMKFSDIKDDYLYIQQQKTGMKLAIPLALHCKALDISLGEVIKQCRDNVLSKYLVHFTKNSSRSLKGHKVNPMTLTATFKDTRNKANLSWKKEPPTFHEMRSLSERLYSEQGINTMMLLGHKSQKMTDKYHDDRGKDWIKIAL